jgi:hypothetical protein
MKIIAYFILALMGALAILATIGCGTPYNVSYVDPATGVVAGYSSKGGITIHYKPLAEK